MTEATVYVVQHVPCETPGLIADVLESNGVTLDFIRPFKGDRIPRRIGAHAGLLIMGEPVLSSCRVVVESGRCGESGLHSQPRVAS